MSRRRGTRWMGNPKGSFLGGGRVGGRVSRARAVAVGIPRRGKVARRARGWGWRRGWRYRPRSPHRPSHPHGERPPTAGCACPRCGGEMRLIAFITTPDAIEAILSHLGEPATPPPLTVPMRQADSRPVRSLGRCECLPAHTSTPLWAPSRVAPRAPSSQEGQWIAYPPPRERLQSRSARPWVSMPNSV
jgi:hypothetical protein